MSVYDKFCLCGRLETGGVVVGILGIVLNVLAIPLSADPLLTLAQGYGEPEPLALQLSANGSGSEDVEIEGLYIQLSAYGSGSEDVEKKGFHEPINIVSIEANKTVLMVLSALLVLFCIVNLIASILLIIGSKKRNSKFVFIWLVAYMISFVMDCITILILVSDLSNLESVVLVFWWKLKIYWWICIYSLYEKFQREKLQPAQIEMMIGAVQTEVCSLSGISRHSRQTV